MVPTTAMASDNDLNQRPMAEIQDMKDMSAGDVQISFDQLLSEHFVLVVPSMQKQYADAPDADGGQMNWRNTEGFRAAITSIYVEEIGPQFMEIW
jgi:hypothetical protein